MGSWLRDQTSGFQDAKKLQKENEELEEKVASLTEENNKLLEDQEELNRLTKLYELDQDYTQYDKVAAQVISKDPGNWYSTFVINRGSDDGIQVDMNVLADGGLAGIVTEVGKDWATVRSIIDDSSNVSATVASTSDNCMVTGKSAADGRRKTEFYTSCWTEKIKYSPATGSSPPISAINF